MAEPLFDLQEGDKVFYQKLQAMCKDKKFHIRSPHEDKNGTVARAPAGEAAAAHRLTVKDGQGKKPFAEGGPYGYKGVGRKGEVPAALKDQTPGFFKLMHYAANVTYDIRDWVDKDLDKISDDAYAMINSTQLCCYMKPYFEKKRDNAAGGATVARDFANSLDRLVSTLQHTTCNFVRCLKASNPLTSNVFKNALVLNQLKYTGMLDTLLIRRGGFPVRMEGQVHSSHEVQHYLRLIYSVSGADGVCHTHTLITLFTGFH